MACPVCSSHNEAVMIDPDTGLPQNVITDLTDNQLMWIAIILLSIGVFVALNK